MDTRQMRTNIGTPQTQSHVQLIRSCMVASHDCILLVRPRHAWTGCRASFPTQRTWGPGQVQHPLPSNYLSAYSSTPTCLFGYPICLFVSRRQSVDLSPAGSLTCTEHRIAHKSMQDPLLQLENQAEGGLMLLYACRLLHA